MNSNTSGATLNNILLFTAIVLLVVGGRLDLMNSLAVGTPYWDDWGIGGLLLKSHTTGVTFHDIVVDANEHRLVFNRLMSIFFFYLNQRQWDPMISMLFNAFVWAASGVLLAFIARKHSSEINSTLLISLIIILWAAPLSLVNILWGVQTHTYTMILFSLMGCWYTGYRAFSAFWWLGMLSLAAASLTLAGGTFAAFSVMTVQIIALLSNSDSDSRRQNSRTLIAALLMGVFGLSLILFQTHGSAPAGFELSSSIITFLKSMSWPYYTQIWPAFIFVAPVVIILISTFRNERGLTELSRFSLAVYGFVVIVCLGIAYARSWDGIGPARRYFEFLALASISSFLALLQIQKLKSALSKALHKLLVAAWILCCLWAIPSLMVTVEYTLDDRAVVKPAQEKFIRGFLNTRDESTLEFQPFRHIPFPEDFEGLVLDLADANLLPYQIQPPIPLQRSANQTRADVEKSPFIKNGSLIASTGKFRNTLFEEDIFGSYKPRDGGMQAMGSFESAEFTTLRSYAAVPVTGYLGYEGLNLAIINVDTGQKTDIVPDLINSKFAEQWRNILVKLPRGTYKVVAEDTNPDLWFGFATPRPVGRLSYWLQQLMDQGRWIWKIGILLLLLSIRTPLANMFSHSKIAPNTPLAS